MGQLQKKKCISVELVHGVRWICIKLYDKEMRKMVQKEAMLNYN